MPDRTGMVVHTFTSFLNRGLSALWHCAAMTAIPHAARAITSAHGRFERASTRLLEAASGAGPGDDTVSPLVEMMQAKHQAKAGVAVIKFSDLMMQELLNIQSETRRRRD
jgi:hypothetical protein